MAIASLLARFNRLKLRAKLAIGFLALIGLMLVGGAAALLGHWRAVSAAESFLDRDNRIAELSLRADADLGKARRYEREFLLKVRSFGFEEAKSRYLTLVAGRLDALREGMADIRRVAGDPETDRQTRSIEALASQYQAGFAQVVDLYGRLGRVDTGLEGQLRERAHAIEALLAQGGPERLQIDLLTLRRHEKDFIMRGTSPYADAFAATAGRFGEDITRSGLPAPRRAELSRLAGEYAGLFRDYVSTEERIDAGTVAYLESAHRVEPLLEQLHGRASGAAAATRDTLRRVTSMTTLTVVLVGLAVILLGLLVAGFVVRATDRSVRACVDFAGRLAGGDWTARLPSAGGDDEFTVLATALNRMADDLQEGYRREELRLAELSRLNRTLRVVSLCNETLVRAESEGELLQAICRHIVDTGGYRLAWVGFARQETDKPIEPVAFAGADGDYVAGLRLTWGDDEGRRGAAGTAIRDGRPVVVRHIPTDPIFAPWRDEAAKRGLAACLALPLRARGETLGALGIYSADDSSFDEEDVRVLRELADDLAFGIVSLREAEGRKRAEQALDYHVNYDSLTGLARRDLFRDRLRQTVVHAGRAGRQVAVLAVGLDRAKAIGDSLGYGAGDAMVRHASRCLTAALREGDTVARLGSDEFAVALSDLAREEDVADLALKLLTAVLQPLQVEGDEIYTSASIGVSVFPRDGDEVDGLMRSANAAMSNARSLGGNLFRFYAPEMNERVAAHFALESDLRRGLERDELRAYFQPRANLMSGEVSGAEALVRWEHPRLGLVPPAQFIPLAEETGLILPLGEWMINSVCRQLRAWLDAGLPAPSVAVNLSGRQFRQENLVAMVKQALDTNGLDAKYLELEITESTLMDDMQQAVATLHQLKALGLRLSLDDFGTGYSSLSHLKSLPIDHLKIDQSFVRDLTTDPEDAAICLAIVGLAHHMGLTVIAEGVETEGQASYLRQHRCDEMQGYYYGRPMPAAEFERLLAERKTLALPAQAPAERRTLLLVDDEPNILASLKRVLRREGYEILSAGSAREGLELLATHAVQVILSDQRMPEMNGTEFLSRVRDLYPDTVRIVLSGYTDIDSITDAINRGAIYKFLTKPWDEEELRQQVRGAFLHHEKAAGRAGAKP